MRVNRDGEIGISNDISDYLNYTCENADDADKIDCTPSAPDVDRESVQNGDSEYEVDDYIDVS